MYAIIGLINVQYASAYDIQYSTDDEHIDDELLFYIMMTITLITIIITQSIFDESLNDILLNLIKCTFFKRCKNVWTTGNHHMINILSSQTNNNNKEMYAKN